MNNNKRDTKGNKLKKGESQRKTGSYEFKVQRNGKRYSVSAPTLNELRQKEHELLLDLDNGIAATSSNTVDDIFQKWIANKRGIRESTRNQYKYVYDCYIKPYYQYRKAKDLTFNDIKAFYNSFADKKYKYKTIEHIDAVLNQVFDYGVRNNYLRYNPATHAIKELRNEPDLSPKPAITLNLEQQKAIEEYLKDEYCRFHEYYPLICLLLHTGIRIGEALALKWGDICFKEKTITIRHTLVIDNKEKRLNPPKTANGNRVIPITSIVDEALTIQRALLDSSGISCKSTLGGYSDFIFVNKHGTVRRETSVNDTFKRIVDSYNKVAQRNNGVLLPYFSGHSFRRSFASNMEKHKVYPKIASEIMGHKDFEMTSHYMDTDINLVRSEYERLESANEVVNKERAIISRLA